MSIGRQTDTIVAPITAMGGAVALVRLSGDQSWAIGQAVFKGSKTEFKPRIATYGQFITGDDGLLTPFANSASYTGEPSIEMSVHGSPASVQALIDACIKQGARIADPGEFTLRAFLNGKIDLTQAEGVRDTVEAQTKTQLRQANLLREGNLREQINAVRDRLIGVLAAIEASTDFSEEVGDLDTAKSLAQLETASVEITRLLETAESARIARHGITIAILGLPNAGKSSLLNAVLKSDRAMVTDIPGTTRDTIEECVSINGLYCRLIDTAGIRETNDPLEILGIQRTKQAIQNADIAWYVYDSQKGWQQKDEEAAKAIHSKVAIIANKCDLSHNNDKGISVSATTGEGLADLLSTVSDSTKNTSIPPLINQRHTPLLEEANQAVERSVLTISSDTPDDLAVVDLQAATRLLGEITGETTPPDVIDRIFHDFCIGK